jgi:hypothetical protein
VEAHSRVQQFWQGVWKRFYVDLGGEEFGYVTVGVQRNYSFNTIISAVCLDPVDDLCGPVGPFKSPPPLRTPHFATKPDHPAEDAGTAALRLVDRLLILRGLRSDWYAAHSRPYLLAVLRTLLRPPSRGPCLAEVLEKAGIYPDLRPDVGACLNDVQLFDRRDKVCYREQYYDTWYWESLTQLAIKAGWAEAKYLRLGHWDESGWLPYLAARQAQQSW